MCAPLTITRASQTSSLLSPHPDHSRQQLTTNTPRWSQKVTMSKVRVEKEFRVQCTFTTITEAPPVDGGTSASSWFVLLLAIAIIVSGLVLYLKPAARERVFRVVQGARARLPVFLGGRSREDTTLLVSDGRMTSSGFGAMSEEFS